MIMVVKNDNSHDFKSLMNHFVMAVIEQIHGYIHEHIQMKKKPISTPAALFTIKSLNMKLLADANANADNLP